MKYILTIAFATLCLTGRVYGDDDKRDGGGKSPKSKQKNKIKND